MALYKIDKDAQGQPTGDLDLVAGGTLWADAPIGTILAYGGESSPAGWLLCQGQSLLRTAYAELFAVIGTAFGSADSTHFNIPDMTGKTAMGVETGHALGASSDGALPNITGGRDNTLSDMIWMGDSISQGAIKHGTPESEYQLGSGALGSFAPLLFDASESSSLYKNNQSYVEPANVRVNYIIKAMMVSAPADFMDAVEDAVAEVTPRVWGPGSKSDWDALPLEEQVKYDEAHFTDDELTGQIVDAVTDGDMRAVTSNAVYDYVQSKLGWTEVSNEISYNSTYVDDVHAYTDGHLFEISIHYLAGTTDQTREVTLPNKYLPKSGMIITLTPFYMNHDDSRQDIVGFVNGNKVELRCYDQIRGSSGVYLYGMWGI